MKQTSFQPSRLSFMTDTMPIHASWQWVVETIRDDKTLEYQTNTYRQLLAEHREANAAGDTERARNTDEAMKTLKRRSPAFFPHAVVEGGRQERHACATSGFVMVDFDHVPPERMAEVGETLRGDSHTFMLYTTYSGLGFRVIAPVDGDYDVKQFRRVWTWVNNYFSLVVKLPVDRQCGNLTRISGMCHDANIYYNPDAAAFPVDEMITSTINPHPSSLNPQPSSIFDRVERMVENKGYQYAEGSHNDYISRCGYLLNKYGVDEGEATRWALSRFADYGARNVESAMRSCYRHTDEHGMWTADDGKVAKVAKVAGASSHTHTRERAREGYGETCDMLEIDLPQPPAFKPYDWPRLLAKAMDCADTDGRRDLIFLGATTVIGASLGRTVRFLYGKRYAYAALQTLAVAPPASGKGVLTWVRRLVEPQHDRLMAQYRKAMATYDREKAAYDCAGRARGDMKQPEQPPMKMFLIAGNNSATGILENLMDADGIGLICESEADTVSAAISTDYGHWSDTLRKAFDHDRIAYNRRANKEYREVNDLCLGVLLSGTPAQVRPLIPSVENGLFSRQVYYALPATTEWQSQFGDVEGDDVDSLFKRWGRAWCDMVERLRSAASVLEFTLSPEQRTAFDDHLSSMFASAGHTMDGALKSWVTRLAINLMRIMAVVALMRILETVVPKHFDIARTKGLAPAHDMPRENVKDGTCARYCYGISEGDFQAVLSLARPLYLHASYVLSLLPKTEVVRQKVTAADALLVELGTTFTADEAIAVGDNLGICENTVKSYLHRMMVGGKIVRTSPGSYALACVGV